MINCLELTLFNANTPEIRLILSQECMTRCSQPSAVLASLEKIARKDAPCRGTLRTLKGRLTKRPLCKDFLLRNACTFLKSLRQFFMTRFAKACFPSPGCGLTCTTKLLFFHCTRMFSVLLKTNSTGPEEGAFTAQSEETVPKRIQQLRSIK